MKETAHPSLWSALARAQSDTLAVSRDEADLVTLAKRALHDAGLVLAVGRTCWAKIDGALLLDRVYLLVHHESESCAELAFQWPHFGSFAAESVAATYNTALRRALIDILNITASPAACGSTGAAPSEGAAAATTPAPPAARGPQAAPSLVVSKEALGDARVASAALELTRTEAEIATRVLAVESQNDHTNHVAAPAPPLGAVRPVVEDEDGGGCNNEPTAVGVSPAAPVEATTPIGEAALVTPGNPTTTPAPARAPCPLGQCDGSGFHPGGVCLCRVGMTKLAPSHDAVRYAQAGEFRARLGADAHADRWAESLYLGDSAEKYPYIEAILTRGDKLHGRVAVEQAWIASGGRISTDGRKRLHRAASKRLDDTDKGTARAFVEKLPREVKGQDRQSPERESPAEPAPTPGTESPK